MSKPLTILFQGDSVTDAGRKREDAHDLGKGYPAYFAKLYEEAREEKNLPECITLNRGISGDRSIDLMARIDEDILDLTPDVLFLLIGVNDTIRQFDMNWITTREQFRDHLETLLKIVRASLEGVKIVLMDPFMLPNFENYSEHRDDLNPRIDVVRQLASEYADLYLPMDGFLNVAAINRYSVAEIAADGVHPTELGHRLMAEYIFAEAYEAGLLSI